MAKTKIKNRAGVKRIQCCPSVGDIFVSKCSNEAFVVTDLEFGMVVLSRNGAIIYRMPLDGFIIDKFKHVAISDGL